MMVIINDILDISKIETGKLRIEFADFDLRAMVDQACAPAQLEARAKGLELDVRIAPDLPEHVRGDGARIRQVLLNLVYNAVKFTDSGSVSVDVGRAAADGIDLVRFAVVDTGIGIDPAVLERMFEPFMQADASMTREYGGNGLGLAIAKDLVERMGGTIAAESEPGAGSTFRFELPLPAAAAPALPPASEPAQRLAAAAEDPAVAPVVLVAEDNQVNREIVVRVLERCGYRAHAVGDGREVLDALADHRYDAVLMDCQLPGLDGYQATARLREREREGHRTPVIAMTAHAMAGDRERCLAAGMDDCITKPIRSEALADVLARWLAADGHAGAGARTPLQAGV